LTQNPILKVLFTFQKFEVECLLIGGQACIIYGAAEFSRDSDFVVFCESENLTKLEKALQSLKAKNIYIPPLEKVFLDKGHACHFRCYDMSVKNLRIDILSKLRGCDDFDKLWERRFTVKLPDKKIVDVISLKDLVQSKKTQRDKDWLMLDRLIETDMGIVQKPKDSKIKWWLFECRNSDKLIELAKRYKLLCEECAKKRPLLTASLQKDGTKLQELLYNEQQLEKNKDKKYWQPLIKELETLRHKMSICGRQSRIK
jgi:hypothetical protein